MRYFEGLSLNQTQNSFFFSSIPYAHTLEVILCTIFSVHTFFTSTSCRKMGLEYSTVSLLLELKMQLRFLDERHPICIISIFI